MDRVQRRDFLIAVGICLAAPRGTQAQQTKKVHRIGYLSFRAQPGLADKAFVQALGELGYTEGNNLVIEYRWAAERAERLPALAEALVALRVDVIVASAGIAIAAAAHATSTIPIVMLSVSAPVGRGFVASLGRPGGNVTGMSLVSTDLAGKRLQLLLELLPRARRVAWIALGGGSAPAQLEEMRATAKGMAIELVPQLVTKAEQLPEAFEQFQRAAAQAIIVPLSPFASTNRATILGLAAQHRLPAMYESRSFVDDGGLVSYGPDSVESFQRAAIFVDKILKGANPGDIPVEQPTRFELVINLTTARSLGLVIPQSMLLRADER